MKESKNNQSPFEQKGELLYSLICFQDIISPLLNLIKPSNICEIGVEKGKFTEFLKSFCVQKDCHYTGIDTCLDDGYIALHTSANASFKKGKSLDVLPELPCQDIYFIDGDHNYYTVFHELEMILAEKEKSPIVILHDVAWPCARRDMYYNPEDIPAAYRNPYSVELGPVMGENTLQETGLSSLFSDLSYAWASEEGGAHNGVLTALEDFIAQENMALWHIVTVPVFFGLAILFNSETLSKSTCKYLVELEQAIKTMQPLLGMLESNRIELFLAFLRSFQHGEKLGKDYDCLSQHASNLKDQYNLISDWGHALEQNLKNIQKTNG